LAIELTQPMPMEPSDKQLLLSCRQGDETAWETLVNRYQRLIYAIPRRSGLDEEQSAEVFQEVFATLFEKINDIDDPDKLHPWLVTTARRKTWRAITKERSWQHFVSIDSEPNTDKELDRLPDNTALPDEIMLEIEQQHRIRLALSSLDDRCQKLLKLLFYEADPPSYSEVASLLGASEGSIGPTRARCLEKMLRILKK
jgi:RNA polymerase sigma factor (sigma-70 family)